MSQNRQTSENNQEKGSKSSDSGASGIINAVWNLLSSTRFAVVLLVLIAAASLLGAFIPQQPSDAELQQMTARWGEGFITFLKSLNMLDLYHSKWFRALLALLCVSLFVCSFDRLPKTWKLVKKSDSVPGAGDPERLRISGGFDHKEDPQTTVEKVKTWLAGKKWKYETAERGDNTFFFVNRGAYSRLGVYVVHFSVILIIIGALVGNIAGFRGRLPVLEGETADSFFRWGEPSGWMNLGFRVECEKFSFSLHPETGMPGDYQSDLVIYNSGRKIDEVKLRVNHPYEYKGISLYQSSYELRGVQNFDVAVYSKAGRKLGEATVPGDGSKVEMPGGGEMRFVRAGQERRTNRVAEITAELDAGDEGTWVLDLKPGKKVVPAGGPMKIEIIAHSAGDGSEAGTLTLREGESGKFNETAVELLQFMPAFPVHGRETEAARVRVTAGGETRRHMLFKAFPDFDKMNRQGDYYFSLGQVKRAEASSPDYDGPRYILASVDELYRTLLDVNHDPGIPLVYTGCTLITLGLFITLFWNHRKLWIKVTPERVSMGATTNRNAGIYETRFNNWAREIENTVNPPDDGRSS